MAIATPAETHAGMVREALVAGKDVFVEKPLCLSVKEGEELVALARQQKRILMVGHLLWYHPAVLKLKELIDATEKTASPGIPDSQNPQTNSSPVSRHRRPNEIQARTRARKNPPRRKYSVVFRPP